MTRDSADLALIRASMLLDSDPAAAARGAVGILAAHPDHEEARLLLATATRRLGDADTAQGVLESLASLQPGSPVIQLELGRCHAAAGRNSDAAASFECAVNLDPALADAWRALADARFRAGDEAGGDAAYLAYSRLIPDPAELTDAQVALAEGRLDAAEAVLLRHLQAAPRDSVALRLLADVAARRGDLASAERTLLASLQAAPGYAEARHDLARLLYEQQRIPEALTLVERLLAADSGNAAYLSLKAQCIRFMGRSAEAVDIMEGLATTHPDRSDIWLLFGNLLRESGDQPRAIDAYRHAIGCQPSLGEAYWALANLKTFRFTPSDRAALEREVELSAALGSNRIHLEFALGKALEDARLYAASFEQYRRGNARQRATLQYDAAAATDFVRRSKALYDARFFDERRAWGSDRRDPIFIVGLPRSGSTLLEQILASHSAIEGTRELPDLPAIVQDLVSGVRQQDPTAPDYPHVVAGLDAASIGALASRYLERTSAHRPRGCARFVDKMLGNFSHVGLIHLAFPQAVIVDARRHPLACGFSCFKQLFGRGMRFSYDLEELGLYWRDYADLMAHIDAVLPGRVHRVDYENLVADPQAEVRRLLDHCGLPFEPACLRFYENPRVVQTVSSEQVRMPLYADALEQWRNYEPWLDPLKAALARPIDPARG